MLMLNANVAVMVHVAWCMGCLVEARVEWSIGGGSIDRQVLTDDYDLSTVSYVDRDLNTGALFQKK